MEDLTLSPRAAALRSQAFRAYRATDAFETAAWRAPEPRRFDARPANDRFSAATPDIGNGSWEDVPRWLVVAAGGLVAAIMGALLGGALAL